MSEGHLSLRHIFGVHHPYIMEPIVPTECGQTILCPELVCQFQRPYAPPLVVAPPRRLRVIPIAYIIIYFLLQILISDNLASVLLAILEPLAVSVVLQLIVIRLHLLMSLVRLPLLRI
jgi:hypothetical protein